MTNFELGVHIPLIIRVPWMVRNVTTPPSRALERHCMSGARLELGVHIPLITRVPWMVRDVTKHYKGGGININ